MNKVTENVDGSVIVEEGIIVGESSDEAGDEKNPIINKLEDLNDLQSNIEYETITVNIREINSNIELNNIIADKLVVKNVSEIIIADSSIKETEVDTENSRPSITIDENSNMENITLKSEAAIANDSQASIKNIYVDTDESIDISGNVENISILKKNRDIYMSRAKVNNLQIKEESYINLLRCNIENIDILKASYVDISRSNVNTVNIREKSKVEISSSEVKLIESSSAAVINLSKPAIIRVLTSTINNNEDKIRVTGYGVIDAKYEKVNGSILLGEYEEDTETDYESMSLGVFNDTEEDAVPIEDELSDEKCDFTVDEGLNNDECDVIVNEELSDNQCDFYYDQELRNDECNFTVEEELNDDEYDFNVDGNSEDSTQEKITGDENYINEEEEKTYLI